MNYQRNWIPSNKINKKHTNLPITQIYCWLTTKDEKIALVSKDHGNWQFPGGKPRENESHFDTLERELDEEISFDLKETKHTPQLFGYYIIKELNDDGKLEKTFLQVRYFQYLEKDSINLKIHPNEKDSEQESERIVTAKWTDINEAKQLIPWLSNSPELATFLELTQ